MRARWRVALLVASIACSSVVATQIAGQGTQSAAKSQATPPPEARVDINHATVNELMKVPGMTATWAARIVRFRPYRTKQDLLDKGVVTSQVYDRIKDYVIAHRDK
jgi:competence protein ComEA